MLKRVNLPKQVYMTDEVLQQIQRDIGDRPPEQGGALLGPPGFPAITYFIYDVWARTTGASYVPSDNLIEQVPRIERDKGLELKGIVHSHPGSMGHPSGQDVHGPFSRALNDNPHLPFFLGPIFTHGTASSYYQDSHHIRCGQGTIAFYVAYRNGSKTEVKPIQCRVVTKKVLARQMSAMEIDQIIPNFPFAVQQFRKDLESVVDLLDVNSELAIIPMEVDERDVYGVQIPLSCNLELTIFISEAYPFTPPIAIVSSVGAERKQPEQLRLTWDLDLPPQRRLVTALAEYFPHKAPEKKTYGTASIQSLTENPTVAELAGWRPFFTRGELVSEKLYSELLERSRGILSQTMFSKHVLVVGLGSVGSYMAELLARSGIGKFTLVDPEFVEGVNLSRTIYEVSDIGRPKVDALARRLLNISPTVQLELHAVDLTDLRLEEVDRLVTKADLVIAATDNFEAQRALNRFAYARGKPAVFVGIYAAAKGGEVIYVLPEITPCYLCAARSGATLGESAPGVDYRTGRLAGEIALAADIQHVSSSAAKVALALLLLEDPLPSELKSFIGVPASQGKSFIAFGNEPNFWVFPKFTSGVLGQYAYQSLWVIVLKQPECEVCGSARRDPMTIPLKPPDVSELRKIHSERKKSDPGSLDEKRP